MGFGYIYIYNVSKTIMNHPFGNGLYYIFMMKSMMIDE